MNFQDFGFIRIGCGTPDVKKANTTDNKEAIIKIINDAKIENISLLLLPELVLTGANLGNLFNQKQLLKAQEDAIFEIVQATENTGITLVLGGYEKTKNNLYKINYIIQDGELLHTHVDSNLSKDEMSTFAYTDENEEVIYLDEQNDITIDFNGNADIHLITSSEEVTVGQFDYMKNYVKMLSGANHNITVLSALNGMAIIAENGNILIAKSPFLKGDFICADCDVEIVHNEKLLTAKPQLFYMEELPINPLKMWNGQPLKREVRPNPFEPATAEELYNNCYEIFEIQSDALAKRLAHTHSKVSVVGISGGLDSTLALLVTAYAHKKLGKPAEDIIAVTMPGFGTTGRTYENALAMMKSVGATVKEISIVDAVTQHFKDIEHDMDVHDVTYENSQARERTQILMDIANQEGGIVVGTGDLSEEALGWCTFNGDHISMFGVNAGVPKTVIKFIVRWFIDVKLKEDFDFSKDNVLLARTLEDILDTPISPELLPPDEDGNIAQKTEDNVGPYELHDFFIFHTVRYGVSPAKLAFLAKEAFGDKYDEDFIAKWLKVFYRRFFAQQFKRSCSPDSPKIGTIDLSPAHWNMPSDAFANEWLNVLK